MYKIVSKEQLSPVIHKMEIEAPRAAASAKPGQFVMIMTHDKGERIPLTIYDRDPKRGTITIIFQEAGKTTRSLARLGAGGSLANVAGPLGRPTGVKKAGRIVMIGGGVGIAELVPIARHSKEMKNDLTIILGARSKELLMLEREMKALTDKLFITTDDGSYGEKGLVTAPLRRLLEKERFDLAYCVGPDIMMKHVCLVTKEFGVKTIVSLDANMVDATGMCGTCRVMVGGQTKFACVDGPEFDGHEIDFTEFMERQKRFNAQEKISLESFAKAHKCRCG
ncbi:MAG: sulfide/dihydroorotate dehydrogenase-like FAD/NAD-binding protein [Candidatus Omnitrophota bacterium]